VILFLNGCVSDDPTRKLIDLVPALPYVEFLPSETSSRFLSETWKLTSDLEVSRRGPTFGSLET
jgi:hypothetical protein